MLVATDPSTGQPIREYPLHSPEEVERRIARAAAAFSEWRDTESDRRGALLRRLAEELRRGMADDARLVTREMGKPIAESEAEIEKCARVCEFYAEHAHRLLAEEPVASEARRSVVRYEPLGAVLGIMPWNFPFWQVFRFAVPAIAAGNVALLKHAPNVPGTALAANERFERAGFPEGVFTLLLVEVDCVPGIIAHPAVQGVALTGSVAAGRAVAAEAGRAIKKCVLELGGSDPFVVLEDAELEAAAEWAVRSRVLNSGQSCIAAKRFIAVEPVAREFERLLVERMRDLVTGDPADRATQVGPLARADLLAALDGQVRRSVAAGARVVLGGRRLERPGFFYPPTVLADVRPGMAAFDEETFGPLAALVAAKDEREAVELANRTPYGLGASVWTRDAERGERAARRLEAGSVFVNGMVRSDPRLPFGGIKRSGFGRELGAAGIREFTNLKTVWVT